MEDIDQIANQIGEIHPKIIKGKQDLSVFLERWIYIFLSICAQMYFTWVRSQTLKKKAIATSGEKNLSFVCAKTFSLQNPWQAQVATGSNQSYAVPTHPIEKWVHIFLQEWTHSWQAAILDSRDRCIGAWLLFAVWAVLRHKCSGLSVWSRCNQSWLSWIFFWSCGHACNWLIV